LYLSHLILSQGNVIRKRGSKIRGPIEGYYISYVCHVSCCNYVMHYRTHSPKISADLSLQADHSAVGAHLLRLAASRGVLSVYTGAGLLTPLDKRSSRFLSVTRCRLQHCISCHGHWALEASMSGSQEWTWVIFSSHNCTAGLKPSASYRPDPTHPLNIGPQ